MSIAASLLPEFDHEMATTRRVLQSVPGDRFEWSPHPKSWTMGGLASHISNLPGLAVLTIQQDSLDIAPPRRPPYRGPVAESPAALLAQLDRNVAAAREAIRTASDEVLLAPWTLLAGGEEFFTLPRVGTLRSLVMSHLIHHRGQLSLYFRLADLPVPSIYGPTADAGGT